MKLLKQECLSHTSNITNSKFMRLHCSIVLLHVREPSWWMTLVGQRSLSYDGVWPPFMEQRTLKKNRFLIIAGLYLTCIRRRRVIVPVPRHKHDMPGLPVQITKLVNGCSLQALSRVRATCFSLLANVSHKHHVGSVREWRVVVPDRIRGWKTQGKFVARVEQILSWRGRLFQ